MCCGHNLPSRRIRQCGRIPRLSRAFYVEPDAQLSCRSSNGLFASTAIVDTHIGTSRSPLRPASRSTDSRVTPRCRPGWFRKIDHGYVGIAGRYAPHAERAAVVVSCVGLYVPRDLKACACIEIADRKTSRTYRTLPKFRAYVACAFARRICRRDTGTAAQRAVCRSNVSSVEQR